MTFVSLDVGEMTLTFRSPLASGVNPPMPITKADQKVKKPLEQALIKIGMDGRIGRQNAGVESLTPSVPLHPSRQQVLKGSKHARRVHPRMREHRQKKSPRSLLGIHSCHCRRSVQALS
ncbi:hypothetical protein FSOLCH5_003070 [Fusarium solani]|nr:hypothetical protein NW759_003301 [Fusarium solani]